MALSFKTDLTLNLLNITLFVLESLYKDLDPALNFANRRMTGSTPKSKGGRVDGWVLGTDPPHDRFWMKDPNSAEWPIIVPAISLFQTERHLHYIVDWPFHVSISLILTKDFVVPVPCTNSRYNNNEAKMSETELFSLMLLSGRRKTLGESAT